MIDEEIKRLEHELAELFVKIGRKDAFGDPGITRIVRKLNKKVSEQKNTKICVSCGGKGGEIHECDCEYCDVEMEECQECAGSGRVEKDQR